MMTIPTNRRVEFIRRPPAPEPPPPVAPPGTLYRPHPHPMTRQRCTAMLHVFPNPYPGDQRNYVSRPWARCDVCGTVGELLAAP